MTDEERQRQMDFIVNTLASVSAKLYTSGERIDGLAEKVDGIAEKVDRLAEKVDGLAAAQVQAELERKASEQERQASELERKADAVRISRLEDALISHSELFKRMFERLDEAFLAISRLSERVEDTFGIMSRLYERMSERLDNHESRIVNVEEVIAALTRLLNRSGNGTGES